jgi:serine/threonine protein phosphatase 1
MRTVIGDIHGGLRALHQIMETKVTKEDTLIFWEIDGGAVISRFSITELNTTNISTVFIRNHDYYCIG